MKPHQAASASLAAKARRRVHSLCLLCLLCLLGAGPARADTLANARALAARGEAAQALRLVDSAMVAEPRDVQLRFLRGVLLMDLKRDAEALALFKQMSLEFPELPDPLNNMAILQVRAGQLDEARVALEAALRNDPTHRAAQANLGRVYLMLSARTWESLAQQGALEPHQQRWLSAVRALLLPAVESKPTNPQP